MPPPLKEPYRIEGKKTMGLEIAEQLGWTPPDVILYPTGGGVGLIGIYKALRELQELGWVKGPLPRLVAVQASGCAPIVQAWQQGSANRASGPTPRPWHLASTCPGAGDFLVLDALYRTEGCAIAVDDRAIQAEIRQLAAPRLEGCFVCRKGRPPSPPPASCGRQLDPGASGWWCSAYRRRHQVPDAITVLPNGCATTGGSRHELRLVLCPPYPAGLRPIGLESPCSSAPS